MNKIYTKLGQLIEKSPFKVLFATLAIVALLLTGALKVSMATGNETLVKTDSQAYISNFKMEEEFGGDAMMVLLTGQQDDLLNQKNIEKMWNVEKRLKHNDEIYSFLSPASIMHQITNKQGEKIIENLPEMSEGLAEISDKLIKIGTELSTQELPDLTTLENQLNELLFSLNANPTMQNMLTQQGMNLSKLQNEMNEMKGSLSSGPSPEKMATMSSGLITMGENLDDLSNGLETFYDKSGMMSPTIPSKQEEIDYVLYDDEGELKEIFSDTVVDDEHLMMMIKLEGNIADSEKDAVFNEVTQAMSAENFDEGSVEYIISGKPVLDASLREEMQTNMQFMVVAAAIVMMIVLFIVFKVRWSILSIGIILVSVIGTLGLMGHLGVSMTMVSMAVFPILIGLGIDFSIQFHNRYEEELSVTKSLTQTGTAIAMAVLASMLGFISLYVSPVPMIQDFGKMLTIGVVVSFLGSIFLLMPILKIRDLHNPEPRHTKLGGQSHTEAEEDGGILSIILGTTTKWVSRFAPVVLLVAIVLSGIGLFADSRVGVETDIETFMPQDMAALEDIRYVRNVVGSTDQIVIYMEDEEILSENNLSWIQVKTEEIETKYESEIEDAKSIHNLVENMAESEDLTYQEQMDFIADLPASQRTMFINDEKTKGAIILNVKHMDIEELEVFVADLEQDLAGAPMKLSVTGKSVLDVEMVEGLTGGRMKMTLLGIALVFLGLFFVYRNPIKALIPVLPVILIVGMSGGIMYLLGFNYTPITATLGALILGMGVETTIMVLERYMEERENGKNKTDALDITISRIGKATLSTEFTTMGGFAVLIFSNFVILKDFGIMTVINVSLVMISTFVVLPAVIWLLDRFIIKE